MECLWAALRATVSMCACLVMQVFDVAVNNFSLPLWNTIYWGLRVLVHVSYRAGGLPTLLLLQA